MIVPMFCFRVFSVTEEEENEVEEGLERDTHAILDLLEKCRNLAFCLLMDDVQLTPSMLWPRTLKRRIN